MLARTSLYSLYAWFITTKWLNTINHSFKSLLNLLVNFVYNSDLKLVWKKLKTLYVTRYK